MANSFQLAQTFLPLLDEVYKANSRTAILDSTKVEIVNGNTIKVFKTDMDGLGNYNRNTGFVDGSVTGTWETLTLGKDRGRSFTVDRMDNEETIGMAFGTLASEFIRTKVTPEIDAYTFAKIAGTTGIDTATAADITIGTTDVPGLIDEAERSMNENEVPVDGRMLFISESAYAGLRSKVTRTVMNGEGGINKEIESYDGMRIIRVPQSRFYTAITLKDGSTSGQTAGGYTGTATTGYKINFMIIHPSAITKVVKHVLPRIFSPDEYQKADAWKFDYRVYHDTFVYDNKVKGIYLHKGATALS
jgi:hypothetical protein|uniref:Major capsid protein n=1 Tax=Siphoviridae sp. ctzyE57 TaxID=2827982 RepID=A0A8S5SGH8_9CAUD|nr:MAG TPA: Major capsid protein [Siphoviridae sp. ctzyE57]